MVGPTPATARPPQLCSLAPCCPVAALPQVRVTSAKGDEGCFDFLVISTGLLTDARLRPELACMADGIATWGDVFTPPPGMERNKLIDDHPYLVGGCGGGCPG